MPGGPLEVGYGVSYLSIAIPVREIKPSDGEHAEQAWSGCGVLTGIISLKYSEPDDRQMCDDLPLQRIAAPL